MSSQYIYLLQEREFIKTNEQIYKVGMTCKENHIRFKQYPKGSILLFQMICTNCKTIEKTIIKIFKHEFKLRDDIGSEYFLGDYNKMIDIIYKTIRGETKEESSDSEPDEEDLSDSDVSITEEPGNTSTDKYKITTSIEWLQINNIDVVITNKKGDGYMRYLDTEYPWIPINSEDKEEDLSYYINKCKMQVGMYSNILNKHITLNEYKLLNTDDKSKFKAVEYEYDIDKIQKNVLIDRFTKISPVYEFKYHEYLMAVHTNGKFKRFIFNSVDFTFTPIGNFTIDKKIITLFEECKTKMIIKNYANTSIIDHILNSLISHEVKLSYKKLLHNILIRKTDDIVVFRDAGECFLSLWLKCMLSGIFSDSISIDSEDFYKDKKHYIKLFETKKPRCVFIHVRKGISIDKQITNFYKLGISNLITISTKKSDIYDLLKYIRCVTENMPPINQYILTENKSPPDGEVNYLNMLVDSSMLQTNFLKWCCT